MDILRKKTSSTVQYLAKQLLSNEEAHRLFELLVASFAVVPEEDKEEEEEEESVGLPVAREGWGRGTRKDTLRGRSCVRGWHGEGELESWGPHSHSNLVLSLWPKIRVEFWNLVSVLGGV